MHVFSLKFCLKQRHYRTKTKLSKTNLIDRLKYGMCQMEVSCYILGTYFWIEPGSMQPSAPSEGKQWALKIIGTGLSDSHRFSRKTGHLQHKRDRGGGHTSPTSQTELKEKPPFFKGTFSLLLRNSCMKNTWGCKAGRKLPALSIIQGYLSSSSSSCNNGCHRLKL